MYFQTSSNQIGVKNVSNIVRILNIPKVYALNIILPDFQTDTIMAV